ncbi:hypothetical protein [Actinoalloteichus sp. GBA129-24]|uniref:hypothetical protein n=1 Tax=Actinoalloteichus sp. GBA129-24 TaxID=1612551 RepID=UPI0009508DDA|nr:hypothetical protein [Actinoalloteichus sp. GBA129-24]APU20906.1 hypothetical protein UA75_14480 [Actinoalloteichus sp. GBA129-24]APU24155.1 hypothetical protein UA75_30960 [Actinoalloteichus sp. GBA129-24]
MPALLDHSNRITRDSYRDIEIAYSAGQIVAVVVRHGDLAEVTRPDGVTTTTVGQRGLLRELDAAHDAAHGPLWPTAEETRAASLLAESDAVDGVLLDEVRRVATDHPTGLPSLTDDQLAALIVCVRRGSASLAVLGS